MPSAYTGYIDVEARHLFFYFFESRRDPNRDDVILWTNGGPGGSSTIGLFMELGPCNLKGPGNTTYNPYGWNAYSNIFFIDQPVGAGFSYADYGEQVVRTMPILCRRLRVNFGVFRAPPWKQLKTSPPSLRSSSNTSPSSKDDRSTWPASRTVYVLHYISPGYQTDCSRVGPVCTCVRLGSLRPEYQARRRGNDSH